MRVRQRVAVGLPPSPGTPDAAVALLRGGGLPALATGALLTAGLTVSGGAGVVGAAVGTAIAVTAMSAGPIVMRLTRRWSPPAVMAVSLAAYSGVVLVLGGIYLALARVAWVSSGHLAAALIACGAAWTVGESRAAWRLRVLAFGDAGVPDDRPSTGGDRGSSAPGQAGETGPELPNPH